MKRKKYKIGDRFDFPEMLFGGNGNYLLAQVNPSEVCLISIKDGNRWNSPIFVKDVYAITEKEFNLITQFG